MKRKATVRRPTCAKIMRTWAARDHTRLPIQNGLIYADAETVLMNKTHAVIAVWLDDDTVLVDSIHTWFEDRAAAKTRDRLIRHTQLSSELVHIPSWAHAPAGMSLLNYIRENRPVVLTPEFFLKYVVPAAARGAKSIDRGFTKPDSASPLEAEFLIRFGRACGFGMPDMTAEEIFYWISGMGVLEATA